MPSCLVAALVDASLPAGALRLYIHLYEQEFRGQCCKPLQLKIDNLARALQVDRSGVSRYLYVLTVKGYVDIVLPLTMPRSYSIPASCPLPLTATRRLW